MEQVNRELLEDGLRAFGCTPDEDAMRSIGRHLDMVLEWNVRVNLTAITAERNMVVKHIIDSAAALTVFDLKAGDSLLDVGTGAGFPGVTLKCLRPGIRLGLLESLAKRCKFLEAVGAELFGLPGSELGGFEVIWGRAEEMGQKSQFRERYDVVVARAVAHLSVLSEYCLPFCRVGGSFLAMKGPTLSEELEEAARAILVLGGQVTEVREVVLPDDAGNRTLVRIDKVRACSSLYPRRAGTPSKSPL
jgi:16S rRNA (guanine527-N7)-methyltransferase